MCLISIGFGIIIGLFIYPIITPPTPPKSEIEIIAWERALPEETFAEYMIRQKIKKRAINEYRKEVLDKKTNKKD
jgi:hypothetical protein